MNVICEHNLVISNRSVSILGNLGKFGNGKSETENSVTEDVVTENSDKVGKCVQDGMSLT